MRKRRGFLSRAFAAAIAIWLGLVITEPLPLDACPMHGVHSMHAASAAGHSMHHASSAGHDAKNPASHQCTCIGDCSAGVGNGLARTASVELDVTLVFAAATGVRSDARSLSSASKHLLPFANGPPAVGSA